MYNVSGNFYGGNSQPGAFEKPQALSPSILSICLP